MAIVRNNWVEEEMEVEGRKITIRFNHRIKRTFWGNIKLVYWILTDSKFIGVVISRVTREEILKQEIGELSNKIESKQIQLKGGI